MRSKMTVIGAMALVMLGGGAGMAQVHPEAEELALIRSIFAKLNARSIAENVEYCGYVGRNAAGELIASEPTRGRALICWAEYSWEIEVMTASYHTHGAYLWDIPSEVPSIDDFRADEWDGVDGYVATPGGRLWHIDISDDMVHQLCGVGCLPSDPDYRPSVRGKVALSYSYDELMELHQY